MQNSFLRIVFFASVVGLIIPQITLARENTQPYKLSVRVLQDVNNIADINISIDVIEPGFSPPTSARRIEFRSPSGIVISRNIELAPAVGAAGFCTIAVILYFSPFGQRSYFDGMLRFNIENDPENKGASRMRLRFRV